ncbi:ATP-binding response regulator [Acanthopleuribacter pedis]|uniref:histidine kinase n=1 Tax=Acanthopleuribacter pedis TaxID=442870 RepID=A0A8J7U1Y3_9BACT|nr:response regulator [Acanthopleuribacter pedis]MBO1318693.1 response regulator [Acanthopleuribacter pedis]
MSTDNLDQSASSPQELDLEAKPARILVVDDEPDLEVLFRQMFRKETRNKIFSFTFVYNGRQALDKLDEDDQFDLVLSDIRMPDMDGLTLLSKIRQRFPLLATVMVTAYGDMVNIRKAMNGGAFDFISKPIQYADLKATIQKTLKYVHELRDLHRHRLEEERARERMVTELRKVNDLKDAFLANTSHELRTPLNGIIGLVESLLRGSGGDFSSEARRNLQVVLYSGQRLAQLINDLLDFSRLRKNELSLYLKPISPFALVDLVLSIMEPLVGDRDLSLVNELPKGIAAVRVDEYRIQQVLINLIGNAVKFSEQGRVTVSAMVEDDWMRISVSDQGPGIPEERQADIFEPFQQGDGSAQRDFGGTGLGLSISRDIVTKHGGEIGLRSKLGEGSQFWFKVPLAGEDAQPLEGFEIALSKPVDLVGAPEEFMESADPAVSTAPVGETLNRRLAGLQTDNYQILAVDDDAVNLQVLEQHLAGFQVTKVSRGAEAVELIEDGNMFDLVLLDVMMPQMSGIEVCQRIREVYGPHELPVLLITAKNQVADLVAGLEAGANDYLTKPISATELIARVHTHLQLLITTRQLRSAQEEARTNARAAGKAKFATSVLHNIGNILNSMNVSMKNIGRVVNGSRVDGLHKANRILDENSGNLPEFFANDEKGEQLLQYYRHLGNLLQKENDDVVEELDNAEKKIGLMKDIIETQQYYSKEKKSLTTVNLDIAVEESLAVQKDLIDERGVKLQVDFKCDIPIMAHQAVLVHVLVNLIKNAVEAMDAVEERRLLIETGTRDEDVPFFRITDSGEGIVNTEEIFQHGFTTKKYGHGYGLHYCMKAVESMNGEMKVASEGKGKGATFELAFKPFLGGDLRHDDPRYRSSN